MPELPDWTQIERRIVDESVAAIARFAAENPDEEVCFFAYDAQPYDGWFGINLDTPPHAEHGAIAADEQRLAARRERFGEDGDDAWKWAKKWAEWSSLRGVHDEVGDLAYQMFHEFEIPELDRLARSPDYGAINRGGEPGRIAGGTDGFIEGHARIALSRAIDALVDRGAFVPLRRAAVFRIGYAYHSEPQAIVCRILRAATS
jgi:hypothetical protein